MISHILFDLDGVLFDGCEFHAEVFIKAVNQINTNKLTREFHDKYLNALSTKQKLAFLADKSYIKDSDKDIIYKLKQDLTASTIEDYLTYSPKLVDMCKWLVQNNYTLYCVSNSIKKTIQICLKKLGIDMFFTDIISNEDVSNPKPNPEPYLKILEKYKLHPNHCIIIEDSPFGLEAAYKSGCHVLKVENTDALNLNVLVQKITECNTIHL